MVGLMLLEEITERFIMSFSQKIFVGGYASPDPPHQLL